MATTVTNSSYITDLSELWFYTDKNRILDLATEDPDTDPTAVPIPDDTQDRIVTALNWGRDVLDNYLRNVYPLDKTAGLVETVSASAPGETVKALNTRLAHFQLRQKRLSPERANSVFEVLRRELSQLKTAGADQILGDAVRSKQVTPVGSGKNPSPLKGDKETIFDGLPGFWPSGITRND